MLVLGLLLALSAAVADAYLHRGIETSEEPPFVMQVSGRGLATNIDLRSFPNSQVESVAATIRASGFEVVRHPFVWSEIEVTRGEFSWDRYDAIVRSFSDAGVQVLAVVYGTPQWARADDDIDAFDAPPERPEDFAEFMSVLVPRYKDVVRFYQIGDAPNLPSHWGGEVATANEYLAVLNPAFNEVRKANPEAHVVLAEFDPFGATGSLGDDLRFLKAIYKAGGAPYFDVIAARVDGGKASPYDRRLSSGTASLSRAILFRETAHEYHDEEKPVWLTHYGWDATTSVDRGTQADYLVTGIDRMRSEWPWAGLVFQWGLRPESVDPVDQGKTLLFPDGTATDAFNALEELARTGLGEFAATGFIPTDSGPLDYSGSWASQHLGGRIFQTTSQIGATLTVRFEGTGLVAYLRWGKESGVVFGTVDGEPLPSWPVEDGRAAIDLRNYETETIAVTLVDGLEDGPHEVVLELGSTGKLTVGGLVVSRDPPLRWPIVLALVSALVLIGVAVREIVLYLGRFSGSLRSVDERDTSPRLPSLPDWRPSLRT